MEEVIVRPVCETLLSLAVSLSGSARALKQPPMALAESISSSALHTATLPAAAQRGSGADPRRDGHKHSEIRL